MEKSVANIVRSILARVGEGEVFDYSLFRVGRFGELAIAKELSRLSKRGIISRVSRGKYVKPRKTKFGNLGADEDEIVRILTYKDNELIGYVTGIPSYNQLGLTNQVPHVLVIARENSPGVAEVGGYKIRFIKRHVPQNPKDVRLMQLLDAIRDIKTIPDTSVAKSIKTLGGFIHNLDRRDQTRLVSLALKSVPSVRALLGAILETYAPGIRLQPLKDSLNPLTTYRLGIDGKTLPTAKDWRIV